MICGICNKEFNKEIAAISRKNRKNRKNRNLYICPDCGTREALDDIPEGLISKETQQAIYELASKVHKEQYK